MGCFFSKEEAPVRKEKTLLDTKQPEKAGTRAGPAEPSNPEAVEAPELLQGQPKKKAAQAAGSAAQEVTEDPGHVVDDVADTAQNVLKDPAEECIERAAALRDEWLSNIAQCSCEDMQVGEVDVVLDTVEKVVTKFLDVFTSKGKQRDADVDIQSLELRKRTKLEQYFAKYSALGQMFIDMSGPAMEAMPFGAPAAAVLGAVYGRAAQAARLSRNCEILLNLLKLVDAQLARVLGRLAKDRKKMHDDVLKALQEVLQQTTKGGRIMKDYVGQGFVLRFILSKGNEIKFYNLDQGIRGAMLKTSFVISMDSLANPADYQPDSSAPLRAAVCAAAGMTEDNLDEKKAQAALRHLRESQPGKLQELFKEHVQQYGSYGDQILVQLLQDVQEDIQQIKGDIVGLRIEFTRLKCFVESQAESSSRQEEHVPLKTYLFAWWKGRIGRRTRSVSVEDFFKRLIDFLKEGEENAIFEYEEEVLKFFPEDMLEVAPKKICLEDGRVLVFFTFVVMPMVDSDKDGVVELDQLLHLQEIGEQCMQKLGESKPPAGMGDLLDYILLGFNKEDFFKRAHYIACTPEVDLVAKKLEVTPMLESMLKNGVRSLLKVHTPDTRQWLFDHVKEWLKTALSAGQDTGTHSQNRMFLLLAGPGMGKTVFSAVMETQLTAQMQTGQKLLLVRHFFKVSEPRAQGKAMVLCLAMQLAEQLPGMAQILLPRAKEHGNANQLTLQDAFNK
ncbi:hypothetical protein DUNSADRAFT_3138 [Dunaliella salina]|uniref:Nephrocystin 3-like N-terminal domain-containing protein n=1 Tax=Dunaliella salina TaxID=3046 RepID=A0ABQ7H827_DUNSA|nr:hypothetical protein DUNSADRAFT_3138 [Dunaliella salina]|eukprot:KAF5843009.1 hypothetical protein DUNSADRAFT_3138 [Dunaliella salina]